MGAQSYPARNLLHALARRSLLRPSRSFNVSFWSAHEKPAEPDLDVDHGYFLDNSPLVGVNGGSRHCGMAAELYVGTTEDTGGGGL